MTGLRVVIRGVAVLGPGLPGWVASVPMLAGDTPWQHADFAPPAPALLPATERRRTSPSVRLALAVAQDAVQMSALPAADLASVFASSNGDGNVIGSILDALQEPLVQISPTQFHNSVHNAAAGYWGIAAGCTRPSVSLGGHDHVFATGLLHAATQVAATGAPVLFCAYDTPLPAPLSGKRRTDIAFATALVLAPGGDGPTLSLCFESNAAEGDPAMAEPLGTLLPMNPVARALPLLAAIAGRREARLAFALTGDSRLGVTVAPG